ncbi:hypothetical protein A2331_02640 [Candidatus Falkowbacteria bacterium RIFOXYB2_FULL_34_18]|uniref:Glycosyltransferase RgtA/B/C/D-like domain-containing protein n=1 Tax=Candidatus Falkowbacteria bacterium RIFOXYD2_FULL_34_120 TaxID=1798007 RepID=A0A1F5TS57_9BACT|nr:MAG: hypothetical protein A2331_02640 [Candidatus Falkowbacteria bacterium RIFOXYB2_FULL_34_18]OGF29638.1 MAG: hypothetical protein A2500_00670 [Candidatus Falkowbacteria bacterium RIFOXYC12_FULL_34_55]OGF37365.1 MAG: hypothetical protein A2466_01440 [Candidatus Falkowbacteria bacterium RIFOXYC2_FULL_34_220]OGF39103.1 MAG: hypothetical protein A2515_00090 [Candidatus Falkowbacteria bacterium RIFOXYD12_FULL_34_57]OGF41627.1 MAG: hypothetical protein A2531_06325 [Candidatus Falkowbacteria bact
MQSFYCFSLPGVLIILKINTRKKQLILRNKVVKIKEVFLYLYYKFIMFNLKDFFVKNKIIIGIFLISIVMGFFWNHKYFDNNLPTGNDPWEYVCVATDLIERHTYTMCGGGEAYREPGYAFVLAGFFSVFGYNPIVVKIFQLFIFGIISVLIYKLGTKLFSRKVGLLAGLFSALWWVFPNYTGILTRETLLTFFMILLCLTLYKATDTQKNKYFVLVGVLLAVLSLTNAIIQYLIFFIVVNFIFILRKKISTKDLMKKILILVISFMIMLSPWLIRNKIVYPEANLAITYRTGGILSLKTYKMEVLYPGIFKYYFGHMFGYYFAEKLWPNLDIRAPKNNYLAGADNDMYVNDGMNRYEREKILAEVNKKKILENPHKYIAISILDFLDFNSPIIPKKIFNGNDYAHYTLAEGRLPQIPEYIKTILLLAFRLWWFLFLSLMSYGIILSIKDWKVSGWMIILMVYFNGVYSAVHAQPRYAIHVYAFYIIFAAFGLVNVYLKIKKNK